MGFFYGFFLIFVLEIKSQTVPCGWSTPDLSTATKDNDQSTRKIKCTGKFNWFGYHTRISYTIIIHKCLTQLSNTNELTHGEKSCLFEAKLSSDNWDVWIGEQCYI